MRISGDRKAFCSTLRPQVEMKYPTFLIPGWRVGCEMTNASFVCNGVSPSEQLVDTGYVRVITHIRGSLVCRRKTQTLPFFFLIQCFSETAAHTQHQHAMEKPVDVLKPRQCFLSAVMQITRAGPRTFSLAVPVLAKTPVIGLTKWQHQNHHVIS